MIADPLKKAVLKAAIQGKLTEQLPEDGNAYDLLEEIKAEKSHLIKVGKIRSEKSLPDITEDEIPFDIPENWCWVRLNDLGMIVGGGTPKTGEKINWDNGDIPWLTPADMKNINGKYVKNGARFITNYGLLHSSAQLMPKGSILFSSRAPIGYLAIADNPICTNQGFKSVVPYKCSMSEFIYFYLMAFTQEIQKLGSGTTFKEVSGAVMKKVIFPLPPLAEQYRIVEQLEKILPEIEGLNVDENKLDTLQQSFPGQMKSSILQTAIQGKLTEQLPEDGDARDLLEEIKAEKERQIKDGKIMKKKPLPEITEDEIPFDVPENWCWVRLCDLGMIIGGGTPKTGEKINWDNGDIPWLTPADMKNVNGKYVKNGERFITKYGLSHSSAQLMPKGAVLFSSRAPIGYLAIADNPICTNQGFKSVVPYKCSMSEFIYFYLMAFTQEIQKLGSGTTFKEVSGAIMKKLIVPVPPLAEQHRIVQRLEGLLPLCDALE